MGHGLEHLSSPANTYYQARPVITMTASLLTTHWGRVHSVHRIYYPVLAWPINVQAYAMPSVPVPPIILLTDMVPRCRLLAAHGLTSCLSARTQPLTATGAPSQTSTIPYHTMGVLPSTQPVATLGYHIHTLPYHTINVTLRPPGIRHRHLPYHTIPYRHPPLGSTGKAGLSCTAGPPAESRQSTTRGRPIDQVMGTACPNAEVRNLRGGSGMNFSERSGAPPPRGGGGWPYSERTS